MYIEYFCLPISDEVDNDTMRVYGAFKYFPNLKEGTRKFSTHMNKEDAPKLLNKKLLDECIKLGEEITKNSYNAVRISKMLINKDMNADIQTGLHLEIYGWVLCFA